jgi:hypothetical protein
MGISVISYPQVMRRRTWLIIVVVFFYMLTWVFGVTEHTRELNTRAQRLWIDADGSNREMALFAADKGLEFDPIELRSTGPRTAVNWSVPILPGVLLVDSEYVVGPLYGKGGVKVVVYYGFGSAELVTLVGWIS